MGENVGQQISDKQPKSSAIQNVEAIRNLSSAFCYHLIRHPDLFCCRAHGVAPLEKMPLIGPDVIHRMM